MADTKRVTLPNGYVLSKREMKVFDRLVKYIDDFIKSKET